MFIYVDQVSKRYWMGEEPVFALRDVSFSIERGEFVSIVGPSGGGKSTLMQLIGGLDRPTLGAVVVNGKNLAFMNDEELARFRNEKIGFVFQFFNLLSYLSALENVMLPLIYSQKRLKREARARKLLELLGLGSKLRHRPTELSGGEQQRVAIARALANDPEIIFADEPTGNLDSRTGSHIIEMLSVLHRAGKTLIIVTHDHHLASHAQRILYLADGRLVKNA